MNKINENELSKRLRAHVFNRGGLSHDSETGQVVIQNGAWDMMLQAADLIEKQEEYISRLENSITESSDYF